MLVSLLGNAVFPEGAKVPPRNRENKACPEALTGNRVRELGYLLSFSKCVLADRQAREPEYWRQRHPYLASGPECLLTVTSLGGQKVCSQPLGFTDPIPKANFTFFFKLLNWT